MKKARFVMSHALLVDLLKLPPDTKILSVGRDANADIVFVVSNDDLPEVADGDTPPLVSPKLTHKWNWNIQGEV